MSEPQHLNATVTVYTVDVTPPVNATVRILETGEVGDVTSVHPDFEHCVFVTVQGKGTRFYAPNEVEVYEAPLAWDAPVVPELSGMPEVDPAYLPLNVAQYIEADARQKRVNEMVEHPTECFNGACKGDWVSVRTSNPCIPFEGSVEKMLWDGRVIVRNGSMTYSTHVTRVRVLATAEERETAAVS